MTDDMMMDRLGSLALGPVASGDLSLFMEALQDDSGTAMPTNGAASRLPSLPGDLEALPTGTVAGGPTWQQGAPYCATQSAGKPVGQPVVSGLHSVAPTSGTPFTTVTGAQAAGWMDPVVVKKVAVDPALAGFDQTSFARNTYNCYDRSSFSSMDAAAYAHPAGVQPGLPEHSDELQRSSFESEQILQSGESSPASSSPESTAVTTRPMTRSLVRRCSLRQEPSTSSLLTAAVMPIGRATMSTTSSSNGAQAAPGEKPKKKVGRPIAYKGDPNNPNLTEEERRRIKRRIANRESARRVRSKRMEVLEEMEVKLHATQNHHARLMHHVAAVEQQKMLMYTRLTELRDKWATTEQQNARLQAEVQELRHMLANAGAAPAGSHVAPPPATAPAAGAPPPAAALPPTPPSPQPNNPRATSFPLGISRRSITITVPQVPCTSLPPPTPHGGPGAPDRRATVTTGPPASVFAPASSCAAPPASASVAPAEGKECVKAAGDKMIKADSLGLPEDWARLGGEPTPLSELVGRPPA